MTSKPHYSPKSARPAASVIAIARHLGVSRQLVSKVLNGGRSSAAASEKTRRRILEAAETLGYRPNMAAKAISTGRFGAVGLLMSTHPERSTLPGDLLRSVGTALAFRGKHLMVAILDDASLTSEGELPSVLSHAMVDGLLVNYTHGIPERMIELIERHRVPAIWLNSRQKSNCVFPDDRRAGQEAAQRLLDAGHRRIAYMDFTYGYEPTFPAHYSISDRRSGYEAAMRSAGLVPALIQSAHHLHGPAAVAEASRALAQSNRPTAIVAYSTAEAELVLNAAAALGLLIPRDLSLITFADPAWRWSGLQVDSYLVPEAELGALAVQSLLAVIEKASRRSAPQAVPFAYAAGETILSPG